MSLVIIARVVKNMPLCNGQVLLEHVISCTELKTNKCLKVGYAQASDKRMVSKVRLGLPLIFLGLESSPVSVNPSID